MLNGISESELLITSSERWDERRHVGLPLQPAKALRGFQYPGGDPALDHRASTPALDVPLHVPNAAHEAFDGVRRGQRVTESVGDVEYQDRQGLVEPLPDAFRSARMVILQPTREIHEHPSSGVDVGAGVGAVQDRSDPGSLPLRQMVEDVAAFVHLTATNERRRDEDLGDRPMQGLGAIDHEQEAAVGAEPPTLEIRQ